MKCILVGDQAVGKTTLAALFQTRKYNKNYNPMLDDIMKKTIKHNSHKIQFNLWDCSNTNLYDLVRPYMYHDTDVVLVCYSVDNKISLNNTGTKWIPEIKKYLPGIPFILVGLKSDLQFEKDSVTENEAKIVAQRFHAQTNIFSSALNNYNINLLFSTAIQISLNNQTPYTLNYLNADQK
ncbi:Rac/Rho-like_protein [Hexamita inflata]|uniref:Rac/Rho-like protein n=1 Tax=Hexamita inflata TaxID=28002 RepID=A0AA86RPU7_9EUKA|nr:Rac/Rho-like protein [Hexamita inflata]